MNGLLRVEVSFHLPVLVASVFTLKYEIIHSVLKIVLPVYYWSWEGTSLYIMEDGLVNPVWLQCHSHLCRCAHVKNILLESMRIISCISLDTLVLVLHHPTL